MTASSSLDRSTPLQPGGQLAPAAETLAQRYARTGLPETELRRLQDRLDRLPMPHPPAGLTYTYDCW